MHLLPVLIGIPFLDQYLHLGVCPVLLGVVVAKTELTVVVVALAVVRVAVSLRFTLALSSDQDQQLLARFKGRCPHNRPWTKAMNLPRLPLRGNSQRPRRLSP